MLFFNFMASVVLFSLIIPPHTLLPQLYLDDNFQKLSPLLCVSKVPYQTKLSFSLSFPIPVEHMLQVFSLNFISFHLMKKLNTCLKITSFEVVKDELWAGKVEQLKEELF